MSESIDVVIDRLFKISQILAVMLTCLGGLAYGITHYILPSILLSAIAYSAFVIFMWFNFFIVLTWHVIAYCLKYVHSGVFKLGQVLTEYILLLVVFVIQIALSVPVVIMIANFIKEL